MDTFKAFALYLQCVCRAIIWFVVLVALLLVAYTAIRLLAILFHHLNATWFTDNEGLSLVLAAAVILGIGFVGQVTREVMDRRQRRRRRPEQGGPPIDFQIRPLE